MEESAGCARPFDVWLLTHSTQAHRQRCLSFLLFIIANSSSTLVPKANGVEKLPIKTWLFGGYHRHLHIGYS